MITFVSEAATTLDQTIAGSAITNRINIFICQGLCCNLTTLDLESLLQQCAGKALGSQLRLERSHFC